MSSIILATPRVIDLTVDLTFPDATAFHFATAAFTDHGNTYSNQLNSVGEIRQTLEAPTDKVDVAIQNLGRVLGQHIAANWQKWGQAQAVIGRKYYKFNRSAIGSNVAFIEMFRGAVQQPNADDQQVTFQVIPDTVAPGQIVCNHTLNPVCGWVFKDAFTCAYAGGLTTCNHLLASSGGCDGRANSEHFGGFEHRYPASQDVPGTGTNDPGNIDPPYNGPCPRLDQFTRARGLDGEILVKMVCFVTDDDWLWHPVKREFRRVVATEIVRDVPIWEATSKCGAVGYSSPRHPLITNADDRHGTAVESMRISGSVLCEIGRDLVDSSIVMLAYTGEVGDVMRITLEGGEPEDKIYTYGDSPDKMFVCHNSKPPLEDLPLS